MFDRLVLGWELFKESALIFRRYPVLLVPPAVAYLFQLFVALVVIAVLHSREWTIGEMVLQLVIFVVLDSFGVVFANSILLELIQQIETYGRTSLTKALFDTVGLNMLSFIPLVLVWSLFILFLMLISAIIDAIRGERGRSGLAETFLDMVDQAVRMLVYLIMPAIAWEDMGFFRAVKRGFHVLKKNKAEFATGFAITWVFGLLVGIPVGLVMYIDSQDVEMPVVVWYLTGAYIVACGMYYMYLEQMFVAMLYLWHLQWEKATRQARQTGAPLPDLQDVRRPSLMDKYLDLRPARVGRKKVRKIAAGSDPQAGGTGTPG